MKLAGKILAVLVLVLVPAGLIRAELIRHFDAHITPHEDGSFTVIETIQYDFETAFRHGIFRDIPKSHPQEASVWYKDRYLDIELQSVQMNGGPVPHEVTNLKSEFSIKIGDPNQEIAGLHTYTIVYKVTGGLSYYEGTTEIYWNVTGHDWPVPILEATARVDTSRSLLLPQRFCYLGFHGETNSCRSVKATSTYVLFKAPFMEPGMGLTIGQELDANKVAMVVLEHSPAWLYWLFGILGWFGLVGGLVYRYKTAHKPVATVVSQYEPYEDFKPMFTGVLIDGHLDNKDITAGLVYLAEQGFLKIKKTDKKVLLFFEVDDYEVTLLKEVGEVETHFLRDVLLLLFDEYDVVGKTVSLSKLKSDSTKRQENSKKVRQLRDAVLDDLIQRGYFERLLPFSTLIVILVAALFAVPFILPFLLPFLSSIVFPIVILIIGTLVVAAFAYQRRTGKGYEARNHLKGFKEFLSVTEKDRLKFHNAPAKNPEQFMRFLSYAIALGVEKEWSEVFKDIQIANPDWYEGGGAHFSAAALSSDIGAFSSAFTQSTSNPDSSGSGGGGFSGGGGGGGGGGSW